MKRKDDRVHVVVDLERFGAPKSMGILRRQPGGKGDVFSFEYDEEWLKDPEAFAFDPDLQLVEGRIYAPASRDNFGIFLDSSPDRWGRVLMQRRAALRSAKGKPQALTAWDYLLGVHDTTRLGSLRFQRTSGGPFLDDDTTQAAPPISSLRELEAISLKLEAPNAEKNPKYEAWLSQLVAPGSSLGGARPKAAVLDENGRLCIAKFPSRADVIDVGGWEAVVHCLAKKAGIEVAPAKALRLGERGHTFVSQRFDRTDTQGRRAFVSAMTLLQRQDGEEGASYLDLVELLQTRGAQTQRDCEQLYRRVIFNICVSNTDDHFRNHGFFIEPKGLVLAPAFDVNPNPDDRTELTLAIDEANASCDVAVALAAAPHYGMKNDQAEKIIQSVTKVVKTWRKEARTIGISGGEQDRIQAAFAGD